jgi:hypothetical protein
MSRGTAWLFAALRCFVFGKCFEFVVALSMARLTAFLFKFKIGVALIVTFQYDLLYYTAFPFFCFSTRFELSGVLPSL